MEDVGAKLLVLGLLWATVIGGDGTVAVKNHWGLVAGSPGAVMVFVGGILLGLAYPFSVNLSK